MSKPIAIIAALIVIAVFVFGFGTRISLSPKATPHTSIAISLTESNFDAEIEKNKGFMLVDLWAEWCGPCREIAPIIEELVTEYKGKVHVAKVNVDFAPKLAERFETTSIPMLVFLKDGKVLDKRLGVQSKESIKTWVDGLVAKNATP
ncbi:MAG: thioredoxin [Planctomycetota bacterium]